MDTAGYLTSQGWLGSGHSLDPSGHGIEEPLLISRKSDLLGLGKRKNEVHADEWWTRDFDTTLKHLNVGTDGVTETPEKEALKTGLEPLERTVHGDLKWGLGNGLYGHFVRGGGLSGTHAPGIVEQVNTDSCQNLRAMKNEDEASSRPKRQRHKHVKRGPFTEKNLFSRHSEYVTPRMDVCGNKTSKFNSCIVKREFEIEVEGESQLRTKPASVNTKKGLHRAEVAPKTNSKKKRKERHRRLRQRL